MDNSMLLAYGAGLVLLYFLIRVLWIPAKVLVSLAYHMVLGGLGLFIFNLVASYFGTHVPINIATAAIAGYLGIPGVALLVIVQRIV